MTAGAGVLVPVAIAIVLIGIGGSVIKPCISGTVQKSHVGRATLAFAIFYMVINIGSIVGRVVAYFVRTRLHGPEPDLRRRDRRVRSWPSSWCSSSTATRTAAAERRRNTLNDVVDRSC